MVERLRVLVFDDREKNATPLIDELRRRNNVVELERVSDLGAISGALERSGWDLIFAIDTIADPEIEAARAMLAERAPNVPFLVVASAERQRMKDQLLLSDRMVTIGTLAAGVAHEINNPLAALMATLQLVALELEDRTKASITREEGEWLSSHVTIPLRDALDATERVRRIVHDLRIFSRPEETHRGPVDVHRVLESSLRMAWNEIRHRARAVKELGTIPPVEGNEARLGQVFLNLLINAAQAIPEGRATENEIRLKTETTANGEVHVEIKDTGAGIAPEHVDRIFEPFFTTKPIGVGTGLGLAICKRIVAELGGRITVESAIGQGTTFRVTLPAASSSPERNGGGGEADRDADRARILIIDDDRAVLHSLRRLLSRQHDVVCVASGREALRTLASSPFDVILCDLMMPDLTGMDLYQEITRAMPAVASRIVFMTGGVFVPSARDFRERVSNQFLEKPFEFRTLSTAIRAVLETASPSEVAQRRSRRVPSGQ
jgi:signal transduction histidine kinase/ActR/RegA family two-component response regulator